MSIGSQNPIANPGIVLREEYDEWALLFDPDSGEIFGLNPTGVLVWKLLDGNHGFADIALRLRKQCEEVPDTAASEIEAFAAELIERGFAGLER